MNDLLDAAQLSFELPTAGDQASPGPKSRGKRAQLPATRPDLAKRLKSFGYRHSVFSVWADFVAMGAITIANAVDRREQVWRAREDEYLKIEAKYTPEERKVFALALHDVMMLLQEEPRDVLGETFMELELGNHWAGQFFTPTEVCQLMAGITLHGMKDTIETQGYVTIQEPAVGGGAMIIGMHNSMLESRLNPQRNMHVTGIDLDIKAVHMAYIQFSLLHIPAVVLHGNSLSLEMYSDWPTPAHILDNWDRRLRFDRARAEDTPGRPDRTTPPPVLSST